MKWMNSIELRPYCSKSSGGMIFSMLVKDKLLSANTAAKSKSNETNQHADPRKIIVGFVEFDIRMLIQASYIKLKLVHDPGPN